MTPDACLALAHQLAPELRGKLHVLHDPTWPSPPGCYAWTSLGRHLGIRDALLAAGQWTGEFLTAIVFIAEPTVEILLHELGHCLPVLGPWSYIEPTDTEKAVQARQVSQWAAGAHYLDPSRPPWATHEARWIRRVLHLWHRAERLGVDVRPVALRCAGPDYGLLHDVCGYQAALNVEPYQLYGQPFDEIERTPLPELFVRTFADDVRAYTLDTLGA